jgi:hypothetical protein
MGRTYNKSSNFYDDEKSSGRSGKHARHTSGKKTGGMRTINRYVEEDYDFNDELFDDDVELNDNIFIQHTKNKP